MTDESYKLIYNKSLDIISRREHSVSELLNKLSLKFDNDQQIPIVIEALIDKNLLNDKRFTSLYIDYRSKKGFGPKKINNELILKGVSQSLISNLIYDKYDWNLLAKKAFKKKFPNGKSDDYKTSIKQKNFLQNKGFGLKEIEFVFS